MDQDILKTYGTSGLESAEILRRAVNAYNENQGDNLRLDWLSQSQVFNLSNCRDLSPQSVDEIVGHDYKIWKLSSQKSTAIDGDYRIQFVQVDTGYRKLGEPIGLSQPAYDDTRPFISRTPDLGVSLKTEIRNYFIIVGPGAPAYDHEASSALTEAFDKPNTNIDVIGDGQAAIDLGEVKIRMHAFIRRCSEKPICVIIRGHGKSTGREYFVKFGAQSWIRNDLLLNVIRTVAVKNRSTIIYATCMSHAALHDMSLLPPGSCLVGFSDGTAIDGDVARWISALRNQNNDIHTPLELLVLYLTSGIRNRISPAIAMTGYRPHHLDDLLRGHIGEAIPTIVVQAVADIACDEERVRRVADKIATASNEWQLSATDYGAALALVLCRALA